jgi:DNA-directed RNA polymerase III subunit RPC2
VNASEENMSRSMMRFEAPYPMRQARSTGSHRKAPNPEAEAAEMLANVVLNHVPVEQFNFRAKVIYICHIIRRILFTVRDPNLLDDKV